MSNFLQTLKQFTSPGGIEGYFAVKYAQWAEKSDMMRDEYKRVAQRAASEVQAGKALEIGPGPGFISLELAQLLPGIDVVGLDLSETMIEMAEKNAQAYGLTGRVRFEQGDAAAMPFQDDSFDLIVSSGSLHHWDEPARIFNEIHRVLKPSGSALVFDLRGDAPQESIDQMAGSIDSKVMRWGLRHSFAEGYTAREIEEILGETPFTQPEIEVGDINLEIRLGK
jgi:ubiquinone/menaquinone biosynthesis C-methylase UbiE